MTPNPDKPTEGKTIKIIMAVILAFTIITAAICIAQFSKSPFHGAPVIDERAYVSWAKDVAGGAVVGDKVFYQDPLYPYFLAAVFSVAGESLVAARLVQGLMGVISVWLVFMAARTLVGGRTGIIAAALLSLCGGLYLYALLILKAETVILVSAASCAVGAWAARDPSAKPRLVGLGFCLGLLSLLRGNALILVPATAAWAFWIDSSAARRQRLVRAALVIAGATAVLFPVGLRNYKVSGDLALTTSQGGANFYIGNNEHANGRYVWLDFVRANPRFEAEDFKNEAQLRAGRTLSPSEVSRFWYMEGMRWIAANPGRALWLFLTKLGMLVHQHEISDNHSLYLIRGEFVSALWAPFLGPGILWGPALLGGIVLLGRGRRGSFPAMFAILYAASIVPFFILSRYRAPLLPPLAIMAAVFIDFVILRVKEGRIKTLLPYAVVAAVTFMVGLYPFAFTRASLVEERFILAQTYLDVSRPAEALGELDLVLSRHPGFWPAEAAWIEALSMMGDGDRSLVKDLAEREGMTAARLVAVGAKLDELGETGHAIRAYERAAKLDPGLIKPHAYLASAYFSRPEFKDLPKAIEHYQLALELKPDYIRLMNGLASCYLEAGDLGLAEHWWMEALSLDPENQAASKGLLRLWRREEERR